VRQALRAGCALVVIAIAIPASAQSLAELARQEEARRTTAAKAVKSYTNGDLRPAENAPPAASEPAQSCYESSSLNKCVPAEELLTRVNASTPNTELAKEEGTWRRSADQIRSQVTKLQDELESVEATAADESRSPGERAVAAGLVAKKTASLRAHQKRWDTLEKDAAFKRVPHKWLEPVPAFPPQQ
jgi:hypothetical protein